jgi:epoxyqueuosine reductase
MSNHEPPTSAAIREFAAQAAESEALLFLGVAPLDVTEAHARFEAWLRDGQHASMHWLEAHRDVRSKPERLLPGARAAFVFALPYSDLRRETASGRSVAKYARFRDYHRVLTEKGGAIGRRLSDAFGGEFRVAVDTLPLLEKALAVGTARGFFGKHSCYIHPVHGSFLLLMELLTTLPVAPDRRPDWDGRKRTNHGGCGSCTLCQVSCPTGALDTAYRVDARKCLSYWTIEHRGPIPSEFWPYLAAYWYGCDLCQDVCPYNRHAAAPLARAAWALPPLEAVATMTQREYESWFGGTAMTRAKRAGLRRNALIALAMTDPDAFVRARERCRDDASLADVLTQLDGAEADGTLERCRAQAVRFRQRHRSR